MKWNKYTIETTTEAEDFVSSMLSDLGIEGVEIEDNTQLSPEDTAKMFIDFLPELPPDEGYVLYRRRMQQKNIFCPVRYILFCMYLLQDAGNV